MSAGKKNTSKVSSLLSKLARTSRTTATWARKHPRRALVLLGLGFFLWFFWPLVYLALVPGLDQNPPKSSAFMELRQEQAEDAGKRFKPSYRYVPMGRISSHLARSVVAAEDGRFYKHHGFDWEAMWDAFSESLEEDKRMRGGSTLTQQLAKNLFLSPDRSPRRKILEAVFTVALEATLSKRKILELYLNVIEWGDGVFGAQAAAQRYYGKSAGALSLDESIRLASITINPRRYGPNRATPRMKTRRAFIADQLVLNGNITAEQRKTLPY